MWICSFSKIISVLAETARLIGDIDLVDNE
jgi:hypothetical protein